MNSLEEQPELGEHVKSWVLLMAHHVGFVPGNGNSEFFYGKTYLRLIS